MNCEHDPVVVESHPWPYRCIYEYTNIQSGPWGTLEFYEAPEGGFHAFQYRADKKPSEEAIIKRWGRIMLNKAPFGECTFKNHGLKIQMEIVQVEDGYSVACRLPDNKASIESVERWPTYHDAMTAYLSCEWSQCDKLTIRMAVS